MVTAGLKEQVDHVHALECMEIWGGNDSVERALSVPGIDAWVLSRPISGSAAGGDIHYVSLCGGSNIARFVLADVSGHGQDVSELAGGLRKLMRRNINRIDQTRFLRAVNSQFGDLSRDGHFATALMATYYAPSDQLIVCNAGHPLPLWYRAERGSWHWLRGDALPEGMDGHARGIRNLPIGVIEPTSYTQFSVTLGAGDLVLIYTDGFIEARNPAGAMIGSDGLKRTVEQMNAAAPDELPGQLLSRLDSYRAGRPSEDDQTLILLHHNGAPPRTPSLGEAARVAAKMLGLMRV